MLWPLRARKSDNYNIFANCSTKFHFKVRKPHFRLRNALFKRVLERNGKHKNILEFDIEKDYCALHWEVCIDMNFIYYLLLSLSIPLSLSIFLSFYLSLSPSLSQKKRIMQIYGCFRPWCYMYIFLTWLYNFRNQN